MTVDSGLRYFIVDAFTDRPFAGNPAAVVPLDRWHDDRWLQNVAMEMNLSETAFFVPDGDGFHLRWFTPKVEVDLCGHATLATAKIIGHLGLVVDGREICFNSRSGKLTARRDGDRIELDFPVNPETKADPPPGLIESLAVDPRYVGKSRFDYLVEVESAAVVRRIAPDFKRLASVSARGVIVTACSDDPRFDFVSRFFAPAAGIDEDPVTGSAHCCLADFWGRRLNKQKMVGYQASSRGGIVHVELRGDRVLLGGGAVIVAEGRLTQAAIVH
ncbi:MAG TPA: PhzF family phenazine biosynthesis protein [Pirellulales bacterium]|nr:PhzF family phenazine biosynthesis protein [Pirellulales bacterium]